MIDIKDIRNNLLKSKGGRVIEIEAVLLGMIGLMIAEAKFNSLTPYTAVAILVIAAIVAFAFPILMGIYKTFAKIVAMIFSFFWACIGWTFGAGIAGFVERDFTVKTFLVGLLVGVIIFLVSYRIHKSYAGFGIQRTEVKAVTSARQADSANHILKEKVSFCPKCGRRITSINGTCDACGR